METDQAKIRHALSEKGLKITPQRIGVLEAIYNLNNHPSADMIIREVRKNHPNIAQGTVYKSLDTFLGKNLIRKVTTEKMVIQYDGIPVPHHHLYCTKNDVITDYFDRDLDKLLRDYFKKNKIKGFNIKEFHLQIKGNFLEK
ncbi:MAG: transcriptional repressor [Marinilabilia sp.]